MCLSLNSPYTNLLFLDLCLPCLCCLFAIDCASNVRFPCVTIVTSKQGAKKTWQNRHLEQAEGCFCICNGPVGGRRLIPHRWYVPPTDHWKMACKLGDITGTVRVSFQF